MSVYRRIRHAAHYGFSHPKKGHDLEQWTFAARANNQRPADVPRDAEYHCGFVEGDVQYWVYVRVAKMSPGTCSRCEDRQ